MGCCISKCKPNKTIPQNHNLQDKLVISQFPPPPSPPQTRKTVQSPPSVTPSSFTSSSETNTCDSSSSLSTQSSLFSNEFLQSCTKEKYPQIVRLDSLLDSPIKHTVEVKQLVPRNTQKRARATSPTLTRQKSFRVEKERSLNMSIVNGRSVMRSPSPSRRFSGYTSPCQRPPMLYSTNIRNENRDRLVKANTRPMSPNCNKIIDKGRPMYLKDNKDTDMEDINNPHIALDCFIFL